MIWLVAPLLAALFQAWRTAVQQRVRAELSLNAAGLVRYLYGLPVSLALLGGWTLWRGTAPGWGDGAVLGWCLAAGLAQIVGTNLLLMAFAQRNFVAGTAYAKTEAIQGAILSLVLLGETLHPLSWAGIALGVGGVMTLSSDGRGWRLADLAQGAALCGLGAGFGFTLTAIFVKLATRGLGLGDPILAALTALVMVQAGQVLMQGSYVLIREREQAWRVVRTWRRSAQVGLLAALGSACWFTGFATAPVALVRTVGQIEVVFTIGFSRLYLRESPTRRDIQGLLLVGGGVMLALAGFLL